MRIATNGTVVTSAARGIAALALLALVGCGGGGGGAATGGVTVVTPPVITSQITVDGAVKTPTALDTLTTRSGHWKFSDLGTVGDSRAYLWRLDENADFVRIMVCRRAFTFENGDTPAFTMQDVAVNIIDRGHTYNWALKVAPGSCRVMQNMEPVAANPQWLRDAVAAFRIPSYKRERAWLPGLPALALDSQRGTYDPASLGPIPGSTDAPTSVNNYVGVTSTQGGEYPSSRGFIHNADARVVDAALHNEDAAIATFMPEFTQYTLYSLAQPQGGVWSTTNHVTVDPQFPATGDRPYEYAHAGARVRADIDSDMELNGWDRDVAHLENTGFVHWIMTEDPVAGMVVQRQAAFALASYYEYLRASPAVAYGVDMEQERGVYNTLSALWKSRDVARRVTSTNGDVIWNQARTDRQASESIASIDAQARLFPSQDIAAVTGAVLREIAPAPWLTTSGATVYYALESNFQGFQYGKEPMWLWTKAGDSTIQRFFKAKVRQAVVRAIYIGGALGVDRAEDIAGSSIPLGPTTTNASGAIVNAPTPFRTDVEWAAWVRAQPLAPQPTDSYDNATVFTAEMMQEMLFFAKNLNLDVPELDAAITRMAADKGRTTAPRFPALQMHKHLGGPPD